MQPSQLKPSCSRARAWCCLALFCTPMLAHAQTPTLDRSSPDRAMMEALLSEVRQLRVALERSTSLVPRIQLATARYQIQQERVDRMERELRTLRAQLSSESSDRDRMTAALRQAEEQLALAPDPAQRKQLEETARAIASGLEEQAGRLQQGLMEESEMSSRLQAEQLKLNDLTEQINQLDQKMQQP